MSQVTVDRDGPLTIVELRSPPLNLFDEALITALETALSAVEARPGAGVLLRAAGRVVSGGVDVRLFDALADAAAAELLFRRLLTISRRVESLPVPTVFAAHGLCLTAAFELALACDLIVAARSARFGLVERAVGLTPAMGGTQRLTALAGPARARELVMTGELYGASELHGWGVVNWVLPDDGFARSAQDVAARIAEGPAAAHALTKKIVRVQQERGTQAADEITATEVAQLIGTRDFRDGVDGFLRNGPPPLRDRDGKPTKVKVTRR
ncbi:enoyl-CoA hydratase/carnithine racemase [Saccharomonospora amisosensis]|uniref:Enoyl-CoA hydratase/carnithine racemase n=1 Tax=Saccharomonospora amisosensis TaxID=1128677 RepID=A0A7X5UNB3_9PSEU|nr:enoyl-CoA hydratase/isomerase family protein [Saccharomonospora amisosensis]NIJ11165.1 enoyl-CoA hydratase/carnithine racemase [Saccharomonospora amisosensis]